MPMEKQKCELPIYIGKFDIFNRGHGNVLTRIVRNSERVIIGVENLSGDYTFPFETRIAMIQKSIDDMLELGCGASQYRKEVIERLKQDPSIVKVVAIHGEIADAVIKNGATQIVRGIRDDFDQHAEEELMEEVLLQLKIKNYHLTSNDYMLINTNGEVVHMSSTKCKNLCERREYIAALHHVTPSVHNMMMPHYLEKTYSELPCGHTHWPYLKKKYLQRRVHNFTRIAYMLNRLKDERKIHEADCRSSTLRMAMFFCHIADTPQKSAEWVEKHLKIAQSRKDDVKRLILLTDYSRIPAPEELNTDARTMLRCCLLLLTDMENYSLYLRQMRVECDPAFEVGRFENLIDPVVYLEKTGIFTDYELQLVKNNLANLSQKK